MSASIRILIIEDEEPFQILYRRLIQPLLSTFESSQVTVTTKLSEAMKVIASTPYQDIVILDLSLAENAVSAIQEIENTSPLVIVSGHSVELIRRIIGHTHHEIVSKSEELSPNKFISVLLRAISAWNQWRYEKQEASIQRMREIIEEHNEPTRKG